MTPLEEFDDLVGSLNEPHQRRKNLQHDARVTRRLALEHWVIPFFFRGDGRRNSPRQAVCESTLHGIQLLLPPRRHRRTIATKRGVSLWNFSPHPNSSQIMWVKCLYLCRLGLGRPRWLSGLGEREKRQGHPRRHHDDRTD